MAKTMITRATLPGIRAAIEAVLEPVMESRGLKVNLAGCSFAADGTNCTFQLKLAVVSDDGRVRTPEASALLRYGPMDNIASDVLSGEAAIVVGGIPCTVVGYKVRSTKRPYIIRELNGTKEYVCSAAAVTTARRWSEVRV